MPQFIRAIGSCMLAGALVSTAVAHATTYYVATTGSNSNPGTESKPWRTVAHAVNTMIAGDTTYVRGGTYDEGTIRFRRSGTQTAPIKLLNYPGETPIINIVGAGTPTYNLMVIEGPSPTSAIGWLTIQGFEINGGWVGIKWYNLHNSEIRNNWIRNSVTQGILGGGGHHNIIDRNIINHTGQFDKCAEVGGVAAPCALQHGIYAHGDTYIITNNLIYDNLAFGIQHNGSPSSYFNPARHPSKAFAEAKNWIIANNTIAYNNNKGAIVEWGDRTTNARIENNIFYENAVNAQSSLPQGIEWVSAGATNIQIRNNLFYASGSGGTVAIGPGTTERVHYTQSGNIINTLDPKFVDAPATLPPSPNFSLTSASPAIDKGLLPEQSPDGGKNLLFTLTRIDFNGTARPQGPAPDIGAYEYRVDGDSHAPDRVQNVQVH